MQRLLKVAVLSTISLSVLFNLINLVSSHWITTNDREGYLHMGLWRACSATACVTLVGADYPKACLIIAFLLGLVCILMASGVLYVESKGPVGVLKTVAWTIASTAFLQLIGMSLGTVVLQFNINFARFSWAFGLGWTAVILSFASAIICAVDHKLEPPEPAPLVTPQLGPQVGPQVGPQAGLQGELKPPPYSPPQGAILPYPGQQGAFQTYQGPPMAYQAQPGPPMAYQPQPGPPIPYQPQPGS